MLSVLYKAVCTRLLQVDFTQRINLCCLCLETVGENAASVEDEVVLNLLGRPSDSIKLSNILKFLLDENLSEVMFILKSVCKQCVTSALAGYKFIQCCKDNAKKLAEVIENLEESLDEIIPNEKISCKSLYVAIQPSNHSTTLIKRYYDMRRQFIPEDTAFLRFTQIVESQKPTPEETQDHVEEIQEQTINIDHVEEVQEETIKVNEIDHTLQALMCCKTNIDTRELLDDPNKPHEFRCKICKELFAKSTSLRVHFFRTHRQIDFKCIKCKTEKDTRATVLTQRQPVVLVTRLKTTDFEQSSTKIVQLNQNSLESDIELPYGDDDDYDYQNDEQNHRESEKDSENLNAEDQYIVKCKIETENCCENCGMKFSTRARYLSHCKKFEGNKCKRRRGRGEFKCKLCNFTAFYKYYVRNHVRVKHLNDKSYTCSYCNKNCSSKAHLKIHLRMHTGEKPFHCDECGERFASRCGLKHHKYIHTGNRPFKCELCDKTFRTGTHRGEHIRRVHKPPLLSCKTCGRMFKVQNDLSRHEVRHTEQPSKTRKKK